MSVSLPFVLVVDDRQMQQSNSLSVLIARALANVEAGCDYASIFYEPERAPGQSYKRVVPWRSSWRGPKDYAQRFNPAQGW